MKITIETIENNLVEVSLEYMGETFKELWEEDATSYHTQGKGIDKKLDDHFAKAINSDSDEYDQATEQMIEKIEEILTELPVTEILDLLRVE